MDKGRDGLNSGSRGTANGCQEKVTVHSRFKIAILDCLAIYIFCFYFFSGDFIMLPSYL